MKCYWVYIMTNRSKMLYVGITSQLDRRIRQHKIGKYEGFTSRYRLDRLVYYELHYDVGRAIRREKEIKGWTRLKKMALIVSINPTWRDLSEEFGKAIPQLPVK